MSHCGTRPDRGRSLASYRSRVGTGTVFSPEDSPLTETLSIAIRRPTPLVGGATKRPDKFTHMWLTVIANKHRTIGVCSMMLSLLARHIPISHGKLASSAVLSRPPPGIAVCSVPATVQPTRRALAPLTSVYYTNAAGPGV